MHVNMYLCPLKYLYQKEAGFFSEVVTYKNCERLNRIQGVDVPSRHVRNE